MVFKRIGRFKIQILDPKLLQIPQIHLQSETDISHIDEFKKMEEKVDGIIFKFHHLWRQVGIFEFDDKLSCRQASQFPSKCASSCNIL
jgi:hypothetical protein